MKFLTQPTLSREIHWDTLTALLEGISSIDLSQIPIKDREEAFQFVLHYGFNLHQPNDAEEIRGVFEDAVRFIETFLLGDSVLNWEKSGEAPSPRKTIPAHIVGELDLIELLLTASAKKPSEDRYWACAVLKVMHTLTHIQNGPYYSYFEEAKKQILSRFHSILTPLDYGTGVLLGSLENHPLHLYAFETKDQKTRESILVKLLCKKEHVAEAIWDLIGVRLITHTVAEAILALNILREEKIIVFPNIIPSRSRNTLVNLEAFKAEYERLSQEGKLSDPALCDTLLRQIDTPPSVGKDFTGHNPSSSQHYQSIHVTCRQLIRFTQPGATQETRFFFPYEIQILDKASYLESQEGSSAHRLYKNKQLVMARRRVLGPLLKG